MTNYVDHRTNSQLHLYRAKQEVDLLQAYVDFLDDADQDLPAFAASMCALGLENLYCCGHNVDKTLKYWTAEDFAERGLSLWRTILLFIPHPDNARTVDDFMADRLAAQ
jgi:hypothetical protein